MIDELYYTTEMELIPKISETMLYQLAKQIHPIKRIRENIYRKIDIEYTDDFLRNTSFIWDAKLIGPELMFSPLNSISLITYHRYGAPALFKPSIAEVMAQLMGKFNKGWDKIKYFTLLSDNLDSSNVIGEYHWCKCVLFGQEFKG